jgi:hypothetical protein
MFIHVDDQVLVFAREKNDDKFFCMLNLSNSPAKYKMQDDLIDYKDAFTEQPVQSVKGGTVDLAKWDYKVFSKT